MIQILRKFSVTIRTDSGYVGNNTRNFTKDKIYPVIGIEETAENPPKFLILADDSGALCWIEEYKCKVSNVE